MKYTSGWMWGLLVILSLSGLSLQVSPQQNPGAQDELQFLMDEFNKSGFPSPRLITISYEIGKKKKDRELLNKTVTMITSYVSMVREVPEHYRRLRQQKVAGIGGSEMAFADQIDDMILRLNEIRGECRYELARLAVSEGKKADAMRLLLDGLRDTQKVHSPAEKEILSLLEIK